MPRKIPHEVVKCKLTNIENDDIEQSKRSDGRRLNTIKRKETPTQLHLASVG